mmetsp:Transcript_127769/g.357735  ORF Transcript_127769/g.357735 Transcript_127769/m.357735 type:complete len:261 (+) Transcript_127769:250-1032(+)
MEIVCNVDCTSLMAATAMISTPCLTNFRNLASAPLGSSWRRVLSSLFTKRSTKSLKMPRAGCALEALALSVLISSLDFLALSHKRTMLSCTSMRNFLVRSSGANLCLSSSSSSSSFCFSAFLAISSSALSSSLFLSSASISFNLSLISCNSWNFSGSPPLSGCNSKAIFLYILLMSVSVASGGNPKNAKADRFWSPLRLAFATSLHFWILATSASSCSVLRELMYSSMSSVFRTMSASRKLGSSNPKRCLSSASVNNLSF